jgi:ABC-type uncharacterized transport system permease subunit
MNNLKFLLAVWKANLLSAMEYRVSFLSQMFGMMLNNGIYSWSGSFSSTASTTCAAGA